MQALLIGNYGVGNLGDEALREYFLQRFTRVEWIVVSGRPTEENEVPRLPCGIRSLLSFRWTKTLCAYRRCDLVVFGGGSLFTDSESVFACLLWWMHAAVSRYFGKPVHLAFQGIGPFSTSFGKALARSVLHMAASVSVRDSASMRCVHALVPEKNIILSCDPVWWLMKKKTGEIRSDAVLLLIPRKNSGQKFLDAAAKACASRQWKEVMVLSLEPCNRREKKYCRMLCRHFGVATVTPIHSVHDLLACIANATLVISERYHGALAALALGKDTVMIARHDGDKLSSLRAADIQKSDVRLQSGEAALLAAFSL